MAKIEAGCKLADFSFNTPFESDVKLSEKAKGAKKTILLFLRYYGCTLCQLDIREYANAYDRIKAKDAQLLVVLQSPASTINAQMKKEDLPFDIICDPDMGLYKEFELGVAASKEEMIRPEDMPKMGEKRAKMEEYGLSHGAYEGEEMQFPGTGCVFFISRSIQNQTAARNPVQSAPCSFHSPEGTIKQGDTPSTDPVPKEESA